MLFICSCEHICKICSRECIKLNASIQTNVFAKKLNFLRSTKVEPISMGSPIRHIISWKLKYVLNQIWRLLDECLDISILHIYREGNKVADFLSNLGCAGVTTSTLHPLPFIEECKVLQNLIQDDLDASTSNHMASKVHSSEWDPSFYALVLKCRAVKHLSSVELSLLVSSNLDLHQVSTFSEVYQVLSCPELEPS